MKQLCVESVKKGVFSNPRPDTAWYHLERLHSIERIRINLKYKTQIVRADASTETDQEWF